MASSTGSTQSWEISWDKNGTCPGMESMFSSGCRLMFGVPWDEHKLPIPCNLTMALGAVFWDRTSTISSPWTHGHRVDQCSMPPFRLSRLFFSQGEECDAFQTERWLAGSGGLTHRLQTGNKRSMAHSVQTCSNFMTRFHVVILVHTVSSTYSQMSLWTFPRLQVPHEAVENAANAAGATFGIGHSSAFFTLKSHKVVERKVVQRSNILIQHFDGNGMKLTWFNSEIHWEIRQAAVLRCSIFQWPSSTSTSYGGLFHTGLDLVQVS